MTRVTFSEIEQGALYPPNSVLVSFKEKLFVSQPLANEAEYNKVLMLAYTKPKGTA